MLFMAFVIILIVTFVIFISIELEAVLQLTLGAILVVLGIVVLLSMWRHPFRSAHHGLGGGVIAFCLLSIIVELIFVGSNLYHIKTLVKLEQANRQFSDYSVTGSKTKRAVYVEGTIGDGLLSEIETFQKKFGSIKVLEINSHGGLVREALNVGSYLEAHRIQVISRTHCDSACILIAVASPAAYAEETLEFGFHGVSSTVDSDDELVKYGTEISGEESRSFMLSHHVPENIVNEAAHIDANHLMSIPALSLFNSGSLAGLVNGNLIVRGVGAGTTVE
jgi:hypothetical protein